MPPTSPPVLRSTTANLHKSHDRRLKSRITDQGLFAGRRKKDKYGRPIKDAKEEAILQDASWHEWILFTLDSARRLEVTALDIDVSMPFAVLPPYVPPEDPPPGTPGSARPVSRPGSRPGTGGMRLFRPRTPKDNGPPVDPDPVLYTLTICRTSPAGDDENTPVFTSEGGAVQVRAQLDSGELCSRDMRRAVLFNEAVEHRRDVLRAKRALRDNGEALSAEGVEHVEGAEALSVAELVMHEVHAPVLSWLVGRGQCDARLARALLFAPRP